MTFTEAAVEVLRLVGKPLHYKKITEVAIARNLLSHVGKTPEITMSSRLATMVRKDRGDAPILKVKPGVFGLRDFSAKVLKAAERETGHEYDLPDDLPEPAPPSAAAVPASESQKLPGQDVFPEEDDDDELILGVLDDEKKEKKRKRRKRKSDRDDDREPRESRRESRRSRNKDSRRGRDRDRDRDRDRGDERVPVAGDVVGDELADAVAVVLGGRGRTPRSLTDIAEALVSRGRLSGDPSSLTPTVAAAVRADAARRERVGATPRFRLNAQGLSLVSWAAPTEASRAEVDALRAATRQRELVRRAFVRRLEDLPAAGLMEILATWLNVEGVSALRAIRREGAGRDEFHLAGVARRGTAKVPVAIIICRSAKSLGRERVVEARGSLHHYGNAREAWLITLGQVLSGALEETEVQGAAPVQLFDGNSLAEAMERAGIGLSRHTIPIVSMDLDLLESLGGKRSEGGRRRRRDEDEGRRKRDDEPKGRRRRGGSKDDQDDKKNEPQSDAKETKDADATDEEEPTGKRRRRRRRRGRDREEAPAETTEENAEASTDAADADATPAADAIDDDADATGDSADASDSDSATDDATEAKAVADDDDDVIIASDATYQGNDEAEEPPGDTEEFAFAGESEE